jgi:hypothetical protein
MESTMRTKFLTAVAAATLLTLSGTAVAFARAADLIWFHESHPVISDIMNHAASTPTQNNTPSVGSSAQAPHSHRYS